MSSVVKRTFRSSPHRTSAETWGAIVDLLTPGKNGSAKAELLAVAGIASSLIADRSMETAPVVVTCDGPRTRIYCTYEGDAIDGTSANEGSVGYDPLSGNWNISLPCSTDDLSWVSDALRKHSSRITARDLTSGFATDEAAEKAVGARAHALELDVSEFLKI
ncbi:hypothetical protein ACAX43_32610 [Paraburkholderia sp. IW21]|uniref:hypothetical protein n=1 Tax=Paraburkholderia sp. IW21 TaxID=3242488 RepID=UPI0035207BC0